MNKKLKRIWFNSMELQRKIIKTISLLVPAPSLRQKVRRDWIAKSRKVYLSQYLYTIDKNVSTKQNNENSNKIWMLWLQGEENAPDVVKACIRSVRKYKPANMELVVLSENDLKNYIDIPQYIYDKKAKGYISSTHFSDIVRVCLLEKYGGIWIDATVLLTAPIPADILNADFFAFSGQGHLKNNNWFIKSNAHSALIKSIKNLLFEYWKNEDGLLDYFIYHLFFDLMIQKNDFLKQEWNKIPVYFEENCYDFGDVLLLEKYDEAKFNEVLGKTTIHKLKYKYDKSKEVKGTFLEKIISL